MSQQDMDLPAEPRVAWDSDGEAWEEIIAENGEPTGVFKARVPDGDGDELTLGQLDQQYGLDSVDAGDRDLLLWLHAEAVWKVEHLTDWRDIDRMALEQVLEERDRAEASRRDWAAEAARAQEKVHQLLGLLDCVHDTEPCWFDHHGGCQAHGFLELQRGEVCPQQKIGEELGAAERDADADPWAPCSCLTAEGAALVAAQPKWSLPLCAVHPEADR